MCASTSVIYSSYIYAVQIICLYRAVVLESYSYMLIYCLLLNAIHPQYNGPLHFLYPILRRFPNFQNNEALKTFTPQPLLPCLFMFFLRQLII